MPSSSAATVGAFCNGLRLPGFGISTSMLTRARRRTAGALSASALAGGTRRGDGSGTAALEADGPAAPAGNASEAEWDLSRRRAGATLGPPPPVPSLRLRFAAGPFSLV